MDSVVAIFFYFDCRNILIYITVKYWLYNDNMCIEINRFYNSQVIYFIIIIQI
jgi:hypothetical protein